MWAEPGDGATGRSRTIAEIACQLCRRRKVKCDRTLPHCQVCIQTSQVCEYPLRPKKPGPKIGSLQRQKRRYRDRDSNSNNSNGNQQQQRNRDRRGSDRHASRSPAGSPVSDAETTRDGSGGGGSNSSNGRASRQDSRDYRPDSVFDDDDADHEYDEEQEHDHHASSARKEQEQSMMVAPGIAAGTTTAAVPLTTTASAIAGAAAPTATTTSPTGTISDEWTRRRRNSRLNINDLSFILHPSHEASTPEKEPLSSSSHPPGGGGPAAPRGSAGALASGQGLVQQACYALGVSEVMLRESIQSYFENMVAINLFHRPSFADKLSAVASPVQLFALLAAMIGYAWRFQQQEQQQERHHQEQHHEDQQQRPIPDMADNSSAIDSILMDTTPSAQPPLLDDDTAPKTPEHFLETARRLIERALDECGDEPPTLCILQACIICTHCELTRGVHGRAWRSLGMCVRLAYEMNLHLVDAREGAAGAGVGADHDEGTAWRDAEEKRRAWWAIWEMDVFASTIRRTPTAVDWTQMETLLPVDDADWFRSGSGSGSGSGLGAKRRRSCFMELDPVRRWKSLQASGNQSPKAWFLVINSLMKDARVISSPRGVPFESKPERCRNSRGGGGRGGDGDDRDHGRRGASSSSSSGAGAGAGGGVRKRRCASPAGPCPVEEARQKLEILANCVQCFVLALPAHLQYRNQFLSFEGTTGAAGAAACTFSSSSSSASASSSSSPRQLHCGIYNIFVMTQLTRLMIHRYELFGSHAQHFRQSAAAAGPFGGKKLSSTAGSATPTSTSPLDNPAVLPYFEAADSILTIVNRSCQEHIQHINPFLLSTLWLAAAVQLVRRHVAVPRSGAGAGATASAAAVAANQHQQTLIKSRFDVLYLTYKRCVAFWNARTAMEQNLEALESQLEGQADQVHHGDQEEHRGHGDRAIDQGEQQAEGEGEEGFARVVDHNKDGDHNRRRKKIRVAKARTRNGLTNGNHVPAVVVVDDRQEFASWTRSDSHPQLSPGSPGQGQESQTWQNYTTQSSVPLQQPPPVTLSISQPPLPPPPPPPLSTYSDPTGTTSAARQLLCSGSPDGGAGYPGGGDALLPAAHAQIGPSQTVAFPDNTVAAVATANTNTNTPRQRRPTASSLNYFKFDSPGQNGFLEPAADNGQAGQAQALLDFMQLSAAQPRTTAGAEAHHHQQQHQHHRAGSFVIDASEAMPDVPLSMISPALFEPDLGMDEQQQQHPNFEWRGLDLPMDIHDLLSGFSAY